MLQAAKGTPFAFDVVSAWQSRQYVWSQYGNNATQSSSTPGYGPQLPLVLFTFQAGNLINPSIVVADGLVVFTTTGSNSNLYAINATTGTLVFNTPSVGGNFISSPAIYQGLIFTANTGSYVNAYTENGALVWSTKISTTNQGNLFLQVENQNVEVNGTLINAFNGTVVQSAAQYPSVYYGGEYFWVSPNSIVTGNVMGSSLVGTSLVNIWNRQITTTSGTYVSPIAMGGNALYFAFKTTSTGSTFFGWSIWGSQIWSSTFAGTVAGGAAVYNNTAYVKTNNAIYGFTQSGLPLFSLAHTNDYYNATLSATPNLLYSLINGRKLYAYNEQNGNVIWNATFSNQTAATLSNTPADVAIAYGNAYFASGNVIYAIGTCKADPGSNLLQTIATFYLNKQGACANLLLNQSYGSNKAAIFINNTYAPSLSSAVFTSNNFILASNVAPLVPGNQITLDLWVNPSALPAKDTFYAGFRNDLNFDFYLSQIAGTNTVEARFRNSAGTAYTQNTVNITITPYKWNNLAFDFNGVSLGVYLNGILVSNSIPGGFITNALTPFMIGGDGITANPRYMNGEISDVQLYNTGLTYANVLNLYTQGLGSVPVSTANIMGWWPLEGDTNDYAMYNYGVPNNGITFGKFPSTPPSLSGSYQISKASVPLVVPVNGIYGVQNVGVVIWR